MSNLIKFMMTVIALALLAYLNAGTIPKSRAEAKRPVVLSLENTVRLTSRYVSPTSPSR